MTKIALIAAATAALLLQATPADAAAKKPVVYKNCAEMNKKYPHGVGKKGSKDLIGGKATSKSVKNFKIDDAVYKANAKRDGDKDGVACEKK